ncbi:MAG: AN1-type zinc finger domain-containing protein [Promethearchaeota archaeon]
MVDCDYCGEPLTYLPFRCKYCGGNFCKEHRLPENHDCHGDYKHPVARKFAQPEVIRQKKREMYADAVGGEPGRISERKLRRLEKRPHRRDYARPWASYTQGPRRPTSVAPYFILTAIILTMVGLFWVQFYNSVALSVENLTGRYLFYTVFTSLFLSSTSWFGFIFFLIMAFFMFQLGKALELRYGSKFFVSLWLVGGLLTGILYLVLSLVFSVIPSSPVAGALVLAVGVGCVTGAFYAMISFMVFFNPEGQAQMLIFIMPVRMKLKWILYLLLGMSLGFGLMYLIMGVVYTTSGGAFEQLYGAAYLAEAAASISPVGGILGGKLMFRNVVGRSRQPPAAIVRWNY